MLCGFEAERPLALALHAFQAAQIGHASDLERCVPPSEQPNGRVVKQTQAGTGTLIRTPRRDAPDGSPTLVSGPTPYAVLRACDIIAHQVLERSSEEGGITCSCELAGAGAQPLVLRARLLRAAGQPWLFAPAPATSDGGDDGGGFAAVALHVEALAPRPTAEALAAVLDDEAFAHGLPEHALHAACDDAGASKRLYVYALGLDGVRVLRSSALAAVCDRLSAQAPLAARSDWLPELSRGLSADSYVAASGVLRDNDARGFRAAGVVLWRRVAGGAAVVLMALETREGWEGDAERHARRLNFLGGKRDYAHEVPEAVAAREAFEETGGRLAPSARERMAQAGSMAPALWAAQGKYVLRPRLTATHSLDGLPSPAPCPSLPHPCHPLHAPAQAHTTARGLH